MNFRNKLLKWLTILSCLVIVQTLTFYLIAYRQLEEELLPDYFQFTHRSDSAYVRNFYGPSEDPPMTTVLSHHLKSDQKRLKERLKVNFIYFDELKGKSVFDEKSFNLAYYTWMERGDWITLSKFYKMSQIEYMIVDKKTIYKREVTYQWCLFFWIKSFEFIQSDDLPAQSTN